MLKKTGHVEENRVRFLGAGYKFPEILLDISPKFLEKYEKFRLHIRK